MYCHLVWKKNIGCCNICTVIWLLRYVTGIGNVSFVICKQARNQRGRCVVGSPRRQLTHNSKFALWRLLQMHRVIDVRWYKMADGDHSVELKDMHSIQVAPAEGTHVPHTNEVDLLKVPHQFYFCWLISFQISFAKMSILSKIHCNILTRSSHRVSYWLICWPHPVNIRVKWQTWFGSLYNNITAHGYSHGYSHFRQFNRSKSILSMDLTKNALFLLNRLRTILKQFTYLNIN